MNVKLAKERRAAVSIQRPYETMVFDFALWLQEGKAKNGPVAISFLKCTL